MKLGARSRLVCVEFQARSMNKSRCEITTNATQLQSTHSETKKQVKKATINESANLQATFKQRSKQSKALQKQRANRVALN